MKVIQLSKDRKVLLPKRVFRPAEKVVLVTEGDTVIIKKLERPRLSSIAKRSAARPVPMREIVKEVHAFRKSKRAR